jgi:creatinine amidohydrolase/Fe(II)-dependent formamide hydrolase-like protein
MRRIAGVAVLMLPLLAAALRAQQLPAKWEDLTAADFVAALQTANNTCALPFGILEKHGPAGVLGTDLINVRFSTLKATKDEYVIVFPEYYVGQIFEAKHQPGTIAYTGIWWYARFPNHYQGNSAGATAARGQATTDAIATQIANALRTIKHDDVAPRLQKEFFERVAKPKL